LSTGIIKADHFGYYPQEVLQDVKTKSAELVNKLYDIYKNTLSKDLEKNGIYIRKFSELRKDQKKFVKQYFETTLYPVITPMAVDPGHPFPILPSKTISFAVSVSRKGQEYLAIIPILKNVPRLLALPAPKNEYNFILIEDILREYLKSFFKGYRVQKYSLFRIIRDSEISVEEDFAPDLLKSIEQEVKKRSRAPVVYMEIEKDCPADLLPMLCDGLQFSVEEVNRVGSYLDLSLFFEMIHRVDKPELCFSGYIPKKVEYENIFEKMKMEDFIVHVPYQSFQPTIDLLSAAAKDDAVIAIKMTLYRTTKDSAIVKALKEAAQNKKQVTVLVEIKARFDEENNIRWVRELEDAGCHVIYGIPGLKVHSKMTLIVRKEEGRIQRYVHLATGNYNENTAKIYTDIGYFTANEDFAKDISEIFNVVTGYSVPSSWKRVVSAPNNLREYIFSLVDQEIKFQKKHKNGLIMAKMNSLEDPLMIEKLYEASQVGVKIHLLVRGICCLAPGVKDLSENIKVHSIVGRFLEHTRIFVFNNHNSPRVFLSSADWMCRNFDKRIELLFEIYKEDVKEHLKEVMDLYWKDNLKTRILGPERTYQRRKIEGEKLNVQDQLILKYGG